MLQRSYTHDHVVMADGSVEFACSMSVDEWPWLELPPQHPLVIQTQNFWCSIGAGQATKTRDDSKWSALTWTAWEIGDPDAGMAVRGTFTGDHNDKGMIFGSRLYDDRDRLIVSIQGKGVVFRTRNFEDWREGSKKKSRIRAPSPMGFSYAKREQLGLSEREPPLLSPLSQTNGQVSVQALITKSNGLMPGHPYFSGSGDHVNSPHLAEIGRQMLCLVQGNPDLHVTHGDMDMHRYVELGVPFSIAVKSLDKSIATFAISQLERSCATISLRWG